MSNATSHDATDIPVGSWVDRWAPSFSRAYLRLARADRPIGSWLLLIPCLWSTALASDGWPNWYYLLLFAVGAVAMRGAGCTINDIVDRDIDQRVARTATRPVASGAISVPKALGFLALQLLIGLLVLVQFNAFTIALALASVGLIVLYPFMKRITYWPQLVLGLVFNWGALVGWSAVSGGLDTAALVLYAGCVMWTIGYDTIYAHQDKADDLIVGVKSTALKFGTRTKPWVAAFYSAIFVSLGVAGFLAGLAWPFYVGLALGGGQLAWQVATVDIDDPDNCLRRFKSNRDFGLLIFAAIVAGRVIA